MEENLELMGYGGSMPDAIYEISPYYRVQRELDLNEARELMIRICERLRDAVNASEELVPYLRPYPFPGSNIGAGILCVDETNSIRGYGCAYLGTGGVSSINQIKGKLCYNNYNPRTKGFERYHTESYEEALAIIRGERPAPEPTPH